MFYRSEATECTGGLAVDKRGHSRRCKWKRFCERSTAPLRENPVPMRDHMAGMGLEVFESYRPCYIEKVPSKPYHR